MCKHVLNGCLLPVYACCMPVLYVCWMSKHCVDNYESSWFRLTCAMYRVFCEPILKGVPFVCYRLNQNKLSLLVWWVNVILPVTCVHCMMDEDVCMCVIRVCVRTRSHMCTLYDGWGCAHVCYTGVCEDSESYVYIVWWVGMCACVLYGCVWGLGVICVHCMMGDSWCMHVCYTGVCEDSESYVYIAW